MEELQRPSSAVEKEERPCRPYPVENGSNHEEGSTTNGTGEYMIPQPLMLFAVYKRFILKHVFLLLRAG